MATAGGVRAAHARFSAARSARAAAGANTARVSKESPGTLSRVFERALWEAARDALAAYHHPSNWHRGAPIQPFPEEIAHFVADALGELCSGQMPETLQLLTSRSGSLTPAQTEDKRIAALYIFAVRQGLVRDPSPRRTVEDLFRVKLRTVDFWVSQHSFAQADLQHYLDDPETAEETIRTLLHSSAEHWKAYRYRTSRRD